MFVRYILLLCALLAAPELQAEEIFKCKSENSGSIVFQNFPCDNDKQVERKSLPDFTKEDSSKEGHGQLTAAQADRLIRARKVAVGMSRADVLKSWGEPKRTSVSLTSLGKSESLFYYQYKSAPVVQVNAKGIVERIDYSESKPSPSKPEKRLGNVRTSGFGQYNRL